MAAVGIAAKDEIVDAFRSWGMNLRDDLNTKNERKRNNNKKEYKKTTCALLQRKRENENKTLR